MCRSDTELNKTQQQALYQLLLQYSDVFATDQYHLSHTELLKYQINTGIVPPIRQHASRIPPAY